MKIQGPNPLLNIYKNQLQKQSNNSKQKIQSDKINISEAAQKLHDKESVVNIKRSEYVQEIKQRVQSGEYKVNYEKTAQKMIDFWSK